jgi:RND superfamily putative drug exporter
VARDADGTLGTVLERWTRAVVRWRLVVIACWVAIIVLGVFSAVKLPDLLTTSLTVPGTSSARANQILEKHFAENIEGSFTVLVRPSDPTPGQRATMDREFAAAATSLPHAHASALSATAGVLYGTITTPLDLGQAAPYTSTLRLALDRAGLHDFEVTGAPALQHDITPVLTSDLRHGELLAVLVALLVLILVLGFSWAVLVPLVVAGCTMAGALTIIYLLAHHFLMVLYIPNLVELIGLGLAVDYSLLIVHRYKEELARPATRPVDAVVATMESAGRTVLVSGLAVTLGLAVLFFIPVPFVRSLGFAGLAVPIVSLLSALTLQPALLSLLARRGVRVAARPFNRRAKSATRPRSGAWARLATFATGRPVAVAVAATVLLALAASSMLWLQLTPGSLRAIPQNSQAARGLAILQGRGGPGIVTPTQIVIDAGAPGRALDREVSAATLRLAVRLTKDPEVFFVSIGSVAPYVDPSGRYRQIEVIGRHEFGAESSQALVKRIRDVDVAAARFPSGVSVSVGGAPAQGVDFLNRVYGHVAWILLLVLLLAYLVLVRAFRSLVLALMAVVLNLLSVAATDGLVVLVFRFGLGADTLGLYRVSQIEGWVPVFLFAMLFGLSMDYEVFFVSRMRESRDDGATTRQAIVEGMGHTGRVVSAAALIMVGALLGLILGRVAGLQELGVGLALGVLVDATVVRGLLVPSLMTLTGPWNWWLPASVARLIGVAASPLAAEEGRAARPEVEDAG